MPSSGLEPLLSAIALRRVRNKNNRVEEVVYHRHGACCVDIFPTVIQSFRAYIYYSDR